MRKHFTEAANEVFFKFVFGSYYQNHLKMSEKELNFQKKLKWTAF